ncbi:hypothetical protein BTHE_1963 [Bifidobacterium thermophilum]|nr:hypothetical protein BTHE_1963 [Bifidobacterium thermophilum]
MTRISRHTQPGRCGRIMRPSAESYRVAYWRAYARCTMSGTQHPAPPTPCTLPLQGCQQLTDRSLHESYIQPNTQNAREICRIGILRVSRAFNTGQAVSCVSCRTARRGASHCCAM